MAEYSRREIREKGPLSVIHAVRKIENMIGEDQSLKEMINAVSRRLDATKSG